MEQKACKDADTEDEDPDDAGGTKALPSGAEEEGLTAQSLLFVELSPSMASKS